MKAVTKCGKIVRYKPTFIGTAVYTLKGELKMVYPPTVPLKSFFRMWRIK